MTNLLIKGGRISEIEVLDHIVIGDNEYYSIVGDRQEKYTEINNTDNLQNSYESLELCENNVVLRQEKVPVKLKYFI